jgi:hypothetical protein
MRRFFLASDGRRSYFKKFLLLGILLPACSLALLANTPSLLQSVPSGGCYCHCAEARSKGGCIKMCDSKRNAGRWRVTTCVKPHMHTHTDNSNAGPRFPHPGRAEHAELTTAPSQSN